MVRPEVLNAAAVYEWLLLLSSQSPLWVPFFGSIILQNLLLSRWLMTSIPAPHLDHTPWLSSCCSAHSFPLSLDGFPSSSWNYIFGVKRDGSLVPFSSLSILPSYESHAVTVLNVNMLMTPYWHYLHRPLLWTWDSEVNFSPWMCIETQTYNTSWTNDFPKCHQNGIRAELGICTSCFIIFQCLSFSLSSNYFQDTAFHLKKLNSQKLSSMVVARASGTGKRGRCLSKSKNSSSKIYRSWDLKYSVVTS